MSITSGPVRRASCAVITVLCLLIAVASVAIWRQNLAIMPIQEQASAYVKRAPSQLPKTDLANFLQQQEVQLTVGNFPASVYSNQGYLWLRLALLQDVDTSDGQQSLEKALHNIKQALAKRPASTFDWARLGFILEKTGAKASALPNAWRMSIMTAPYEPELLTWRLETYLRDPDNFRSPEDATLFQQQLKNSWQYSPWRTARILAKFQQPDLIKPVLGDDKKAAADFAKSYAHFARLFTRFRSTAASPDSSAP